MSATTPKLSVAAKMRRTIFHIIAAIGFCWALFGLVSLLSDLKFLVDGLGWAINHDFSLRALLLEVGRRISAVISSYREFLINLAYSFHLPVFPHYVYDIAGIVGLSAGRGYWLGRTETKQIKQWSAEYNELLERHFAIIDDSIKNNSYDISNGELTLINEQIKNKREQIDKMSYPFPLFKPILTLVLWIRSGLGLTVTSGTRTFVYFCLIAIVLCVLFGIDYLYKTFA
jgi:hypothetical protein